MTDELKTPETGYLQLLTREIRLPDSLEEPIQYWCRTRPLPDIPSLHPEMIKYLPK